MLKSMLKSMLHLARGFVHTVWNLAAPLSVETAKNPLIARQVTINGMRNVLWAMYEAKIKKIPGSAIKLLKHSFKAHIYIIHCVLLLCVFRFSLLYILYYTILHYILYVYINY